MLPPDTGNSQKYGSKLFVETSETFPKFSPPVLLYITLVFFTVVKRGDH